MRIILKHLDHRNMGSVMTWTHGHEDNFKSTTMEVLGFTHEDGYTTVHTHLGDHRLPNTMSVDIQLPKQAMLLAQLLTELEHQGMPGHA